MMEAQAYDRDAKILWRSKFIVEAFMVEVQCHARDTNLWYRCKLKLEVQGV